MSTKTISTRHEREVCDVCERTLLRGEQPEVFVNAGRRYSVCELCKPRALHAGWMREGVLPDYPDLAVAPDRRHSLFHRRRARRDGAAAQSEAGAGTPKRLTLDDELSRGAWELEPAQREPPQRVPRASRRRTRHAAQAQREPRHVHAIPTRGDHKVAAALKAFNRTEHRRTVAGVARSLGAPGVSITPDQTHASIVWIVAAWELCWYRYEVDLSDERGNVRVAAQGYELEDLAVHERQANARADQNGNLLLL